MRTHSLCSLSLLFSICFTSRISAGPITGRVIDPHGRPVPGASVFIAKEATVAGSTSTDPSGAFVLQAPDDGAFEVRVAIYGFKASPLVLVGEPGSRDVGTIALSLSAQTESVSVAGSTTPMPLSISGSSITMITGREIEARQAESVHDVLRIVPGLAIASSGGRGAITGLFPRGGEADYSLVLIDDVPVNAFGGSFDFAHIPAVNIDRIEIARGPQSALYGSNAIGSVIRITTRRHTRPQASGSIEGGSFGTLRLTGASSGDVGNWQWGVAAERLASDGLNGEQSNGRLTIANDDYERHMAAAGGGWRTAHGASVSGDVKFLSDQRGFPGPFGSDPIGAFSGIDDVSRGTNERWLASLSAATSHHRRVSGLVQATHGRLESTFEAPFGSSESYWRRSTVRLQSNVLMHGVYSSFGAEVQRERAGSTFITAEGSRQVPVERTLAGFFGEGRLTPIPPIFITAGVRVERITRHSLPGDPNAFAPRPDFERDTVVSVNPKLSASWFVRSVNGTQTKLRVSAGTGIRPPDAFDIAFTDNPGLKPERSRSFDFGIDQTFARDHVLIEATGFFNNFDDLIVAVGSFGGSRYRTDNISNARSRGFEIAGTARAVVPALQYARIDLRIGYTLLDTEILAVDQGSGAPPPFTVGDALLRRPKHQLGVDLGVEAGRLNAFVQVGGRSRVRDVEPTLGTFGGIFDAAGYSVWHAGASWRIRAQLSLFGRVNNVFNRDYEEVFGFPALPRGFVAGVRVAAGH